MIASRNSQSLEEFRRDPEPVARLKVTGQPVVLTVDGKVELVVQDAVAYQKLVAAAARAEAIEGIRRGLEDMRAGRTEPVDAAFAAIRRDLGLPDTP